MKTPTFTPRPRHIAALASVAINVALLGALHTGLAVRAADTVVQLPGVTVVGKRQGTPEAVLALTAKPLPSIAHAKL